MSQDRYAVAAAVILICLLAAVTVLPLAVGVLFAAPGLVLVAVVWWLWRRRQLPRR